MIEHVLVGKMGKDRQGKVRGKCTEEGCGCGEFEQAKSGGVKCGACRHTPVKHHLLDSGVPDNSTRIGEIHQVHTSSGNVLCHSCSDYFSEDEHGLCPKCRPRQECAYSNCPRLAYYSPQFSQPFKYCSPVCRDNDMVRSGNAQQALEKALSDIKQQHKMNIAETVETNECKPQQTTSHDSPTDESQEVEMVVFVDNKGAENSLTSGGDIADAGFQSFV